MVIGLVLPWFTINAGRDLSRAMRSLPGPALQVSPAVTISTPTYQVAGYAVAGKQGIIIALMGCSTVWWIWLGRRWQAPWVALAAWPCLALAFIKLSKLASLHWHFASYGVLITFLGLLVGSVGCVLEVLKR